MMGVLLLTLMLVWSSEASSVAPTPYNVLMLSPISSPSHNCILMHIAQALAERGHQITLLTNYEVTKRIANVTTMTHGVPYVKSENFDLFNQGRTKLDIISLVPPLLTNMTQAVYETGVVRELYQRKDHFDIVIIDFFYNEMMYPFVVGKPFITLTPCCHDPVHSASYGNNPNPAYVSHSFHHYQNPLSVFERLENLFYSIIIPLLRHFVVMVPIQNQLALQFPSLPPLAQIEANQSVAFINSHFSMASPPEALMPGQVEIGSIHCRPGRPLPQDLDDFVSSERPVVLMSLGSSLSIKYLSAKHRNMIISAFSKLPYKFIWKIDYFNNVSSNVLVKDWVPQQDLLAHPNVKLFITHGGTLGMQEAVYHATPMLAMPITCDQPKNAMRITNMGIGLSLSWDDVTEDKIIHTVNTLITQPQYREKVSKMSEVFRDQPFTPSEHVVYWTEYVVRHGGAHHLRSAERDLPWLVLRGIDLLLLFNVSIIVLWLLVKRLYSYRTTAVNSNKSKKD